MPASTIRTAADKQSKHPLRSSTIDATHANEPVAFGTKIRSGFDKLHLTQNNKTDYHFDLAKIIFKATDQALGDQSTLAIQHAELKISTHFKKDARTGNRQGDTWSIEGKSSLSHTVETSDKASAITLKWSRTAGWPVFDVDMGDVTLRYQQRSEDVMPIGGLLLEWNIWTETIASADSQQMFITNYTMTVSWAVPVEEPKRYTARAWSQCPCCIPPEAAK